MPAEEFEDCALHRRIAETAAQFIRGEPGQRKEPLGPVAVAKHPAERLQRRGGRIGCREDFAGDCQGLSG